MAIFCLFTQKNVSQTICNIRPRILLTINRKSTGSIDELIYHGLYTRTAVACHPCFSFSWAFLLLWIMATPLQLTFRRTNSSGSSHWWTPLPGWCFIVQIRPHPTPLLHQLHWLNAPERVQYKLASFSGSPVLQWNGTDVTGLWALPARVQTPPTIMQRRRHHRLSAVYIHVVVNRRWSSFSDRRCSYLEGTLCRAMARPHHICQFSVDAWRPTSSLDFVVPVKWLSHYWTL